MASIRGSLRIITLIGGLVGLLMAGGATAGVDKPVLERGKGERCVEDTAFMRRNHMELLKHQRDETMHKGIRTPRHSLKGCVDCHASSKTGSVAASKEDFCAACHVYAGVKLDCWDCHATKPMQKPRQAAVQTQASPLMADTQQEGMQR